MRRIIYRGTDKKWYPAKLDGSFDTGSIVMDDGRRFPMSGVDKNTVKSFDALTSVESLRLILGLPEKMPLDLEGEWEFEGFRYKLFSAKEALARKGKGRMAQRFCIWCEKCEEWIPAGRRGQEKHLRPLWKFKAEVERMT